MGCFLILIVIALALMFGAWPVLGWVLLILAALWLMSALFD